VSTSIPRRTLIGISHTLPDALGVDEIEDSSETLWRLQIGRPC